MDRYSFLLLSCLGLAASVWIDPVQAGQFNKVLDIGNESPRWSGLVGVDDQLHSLDDLADFKIIVVAFTCNSCPYAVDADDRLNELHAKYADQGVAVVAINVNKIEEDLLPAMKEKAKQKGFKFLYLFDESQQVGKDFGANYTPEFFVLDTNRRVVYMGSQDDSPDGKKITKRYVQLAIESTLRGQHPEVTETVPIGCRIRYERQRRTRKQK